MLACPKFWISAIYCAIFLIFFFFVFSSSVSALSFKIENVKPDSVSSKNQEVEVLLAITDLSSESYFRVAWQGKEGGSYFGYVKDNDGNWIEIKPLSSEECFSYYKVSQTGNSQITLVTKIGENIELSSEIYLLRAHRFTSTCKSYTASDNAFEISVSLTTPTPSPNPSPSLSQTPASSPSPSLSPTTATYKINDVKDEEGSVLSSVKVYVDGVYVHHYAPETLTFCGDCQCDTYVDCGFGEHSIRLEKSGYENWEETEIINSGDSYEVDPIMSETDSDSSLASTPSPSPALTPSPKPVEVTGATLLGKILGEEESSPAGFYPWEATEEAKSQEATETSRAKFIPKLFLGSGLVFLATAGIYLWYNSSERRMIQG